MNKRITRKFFAAMAVITLFTLGASAQILDDTNWKEGGYGGGADAGEEIDSVTVGARVGFFAEPDPYYHPNYVTPNWLITNGTDWHWFPAGATQTVTTDFTTTISDTNYIEITFGNTPGLDSIGVSELSTLGCGGDTTYLKVRVLAEPTVTFSADDDANDTIGANLVLCEGDPRLDGSQSVYASFTGIPTYHLDYSLEIYTLDTDGSTILNFYDLTKADIGNGPTSASGDTAFWAQNAAGTQIQNISNNVYGLTQPTGAFTSITETGQKKTTVYKYTIMGATGRISRKSDYLSNTAASAAGWTLYDTAPEVITIQVNPAPVTGPIYHISNTWVN